METVMISGTTKGLGKELAKLFCENDYNYYGLSKWSDLDITDYKTINNYIDSIPVSDFPKILINNAGICIPNTLLEMQTEDIFNTFNVNLFALINLSQKFAKKSIEYGLKTKIVNIASTAGMGARPGRSLYSASKASVINFSKSIAEELKEYNIKIYCICPGAFDSDLRHYIEPDDDFENMLKPYEVAKEIFNIIKSEYLDNQIIYIRR